MLLITSRDTQRWVIPKGWPIEGRAPHEAAEIEAWEEAGAKGRISTRPIGAFNYDKLHPAKAAIRCEVSVFPLRVAELAAQFPEKGQRRRKWFAATKASKLVAESELSDLLKSVDKLLIEHAAD